MSDVPLELLAEKANAGNADALETLVRRIQDQVHRLALRMLANPTEAEDATQDILIRIITKLSTFRGESRFETWVYRVASNHLLNAVRRSPAEAMLSFDAFAADLETGLVDPDQQAPEDHVLLNELRIGCTMAMLLCLDRPHRIAYVLGEVFEMEQTEAAEVLEISKDLFRQRLSRARKKVTDFTAQSCGLVAQSAPCSCRKRLPAAIDLGRMPKSPLPLLADAPDFATARTSAQGLERALMTAKLQRATGPLRAQKDFAAQLERLVSPPS